MSTISVVELLFEGEFVFLDHRVGEDLARDPGYFRLSLGSREGGIQADLEVFALPYSVQIVVSHFLKGIVDGLALGIEHTLLQGNVYVSHHRNHYYTSSDN